MATQSQKSSRQLGRWKESYQKSFGIAFLLAAFFHLLVTTVYHVVTERPHTELSVTVEKREYDLTRPPVKSKLRGPKLAKAFEASKVPPYSQTLGPREIKLDETQVTNTETPTKETSTDRTNKIEGSIFYAAMTGSSSPEASWGIPGGAVAFGQSLGIGRHLAWGQDQTVGTDFFPELNEEVRNLRQSGTGLQSMRNELVSPENLTDRFEGFIETDPLNKKKVKGFINIYRVHWRATKQEPNGEEGWNVFPFALPMLQKYAEESTDVQVTLAGNLHLDDRRLSTVPILFMIGNTAAIQYTQFEAQNLGKWLRSGGFLFIDDGYAQTSGAFNTSARSLLRDALSYDANFVRIPPTHMIYHCWDDFGGPPPGVDDTNIPVQMDGKTPQRMNERYPYLEGIFLEGRLAVLFSSKGYSHGWGDWRFNSPGQADRWTTRVSFASGSTS